METKKYQCTACLKITYKEDPLGICDCSRGLNTNARISIKPTIILVK